MLLVAAVAETRFFRLARILASLISFGGYFLKLGECGFRLAQPSCPSGSVIFVILVVLIAC